jgi:hypothetical protein
MEIPIMARVMATRRRVFLLLLFVMLVLAIGGATVIGKELSDEALDSDLATPELIQQAYEAGEISAGERLLYLAYATIEHDSLPARFRSSVGWFGTSTVRELERAFAKIASGDGPAMAESVRRELARLENITNDVCKAEDGPSESQSAHFYLNFASIGGELTAEIYLASLEAAWQTEVNQYSWPLPPLCTETDEDCGDDNPWDKYPVLATDLGPGLFGQVWLGEGKYTGFIGDNPNTGEQEDDAWATCMELNSDFSQITRNTPLENVKITAAHEYFHAIHFGIGFDDALEKDMWTESMATYVEDEVADSVNDGINYLWPDFKWCLGNWPNGDTSSYSNWLFFRYAAERHGGTNISGGGEEIAQAFLRSAALNQTGLQAMESALNNKGTDLSEFFHDYAIATRLMRSCPNADPYCYEEAADYTGAKGPVENNADLSPYHFKQATGKQNDHYSVVWIGLPTDGIYSIAVENIGLSYSGKLRISVVAKTPSGLEITHYSPIALDPFDEEVIVDKAFEPPEDTTEVVAVITNEQRGNISTNPISCEEMEYALSVARPIVFVLDDTSSMADEIADARTAMINKVDKLEESFIYPNYHLVTYKDTVNYQGNTNDPDEIRDWLNGVNASGGADCPEEMLGALERVADEAEYGEAWLITDAGFHGSITDLVQTISQLVDANVKVHPVLLSWLLCFDSGESASTTNTYSLDDEPGIRLPVVDGDLGRQSFFQIATETGGHYFRIASSETTSATDVLLSEMTAGADLALNRDQVGIPNAVADGSFEDGPPPDSAWTEVTNNTDCTQIGDWMDTWEAPSYHGVFDFWAGGRCNDVITTNSVSQTITIPVTSTTLSFQYMTFRQSPDDPIPDDYGYVTVNGSQVWQLDLTQANNTRPNWVEVAVDLSAYAGQTVSLRLGVQNTGDNNGNMRVDYVKMLGGNPPNPPRIYQVPIDETTTTVNFLLNMFKGGAELEVRDPNGIVVQTDDPGVTYTNFRGAQYYEIADPAAGVWEIQISGEGSFSFSSSGDSGINLEYLGSTSWAQGAMEQLRARLSGPVDTAEFQLVTPEGTLVDILPLFDDGVHGDGEAGDGFFAGSYTPTAQGNYYLRVEGLDDNGDPYTRMATKVIRVHTLQVVAPDGQSAEPGDTILYEFTIYNTGGTAQTYNLSLSSDLGWADPGGIPASVQVPGGGSAVVQVTVNVPETAVPGSADRTTLVAISQADPLVNDSGSVVTTVPDIVLGELVYLPFLER